MILSTTEALRLGAGDALNERAIDQLDLVIALVVILDQLSRDDAQ